MSDWRSDVCCSDLAVGPGAQRTDQLVEVGEAPPPRHRLQAVLDEVGLLGGDHEAGLLLEHGRHHLEVRRVHAARLMVCRCTQAAISPSGSTALHNPARATAPGIPHTTTVASSSATTVPPASTSTAPPFWPSFPIPVQITPTA